LGRLSGIVSVVAIGIKKHVDVEVATETAAGDSYGVPTAPPVGFRVKPLVPPVPKVEATVKAAEPVVLPKVANM